ncbi:hypothetical protein [Pseudolysinimonas sp.]|uniref:hypothetical protein n=1 Tax=Pseudolysinimonas sp. TaxID=2680009 RepID=UPI003F7EE550
MTDTSDTPFDDSPRDAERAMQTTTNDAVAGETVEPVDSFAGPNGAEKPEAEPTYGPGDDRVPPEDIVLREDDDPSDSGSPDVGRES